MSELIADETNKRTGRKITCPIAVYWGAKGILNETIDPLETWRDWCESVTGHPINSGRFLVEENPGETAKAILSFLTP